MKLILEITHHADEQTAHRVVETFPVTLGRGYHNDIIISDPHVGASHLRIDYDGKDWTLTDLGSVNPTKVNAKPYRNVTTRLSSGDVLRVGGTELRVFAAEHPVAPPAPLQRESAALPWLTRTRNVWALFVLAVAAVTGWSYVGIWTDNMGLALTAAASGAMITIVIWAALWSVGGRLARRRSYFMGHVALGSLGLIFGALAWLTSCYIGFLSSENGFSVATDYALNGAVMAWLLYASLSLATRLTRRKRLQAALFFAGGLMLGIFTVGMISSEKFSADALYPYRLEPFLSGLAPAQTPDEFMARSAKLFKSDEFEQPGKTKE